MSEWYNIKEQSAGKYRLLFLWFVYKLIKLKGLKIVLYPIVAVISIFCHSARKYSGEYRNILYQYCENHSVQYSKFSGFRHILNYSYSMADKMSAICDADTPIKFCINKNNDWDNFQSNIRNGTGVFLISSHLGNIEAFCAFAKSSPEQQSKKLHAIMEVSQNSIFHNFIKSKTSNRSFNLYPAEQINFQIIMSLYENLCNGEMVLMAGDRVSAENRKKTIAGTLLDKNCLFPEGTFMFAKKMKHPTYAIILPYIGNNTYKIHVKEIDCTKSIENAVNQYSDFIEQNIIKYPTQWYNFYSFFK